MNHIGQKNLLKGEGTCDGKSEYCLYHYFSEIGFIPFANWRESTVLDDNNLGLWCMVRIT